MNNKNWPIELIHKQKAHNLYPGSHIVKIETRMTAFNMIS